VEKESRPRAVSSTRFWSGRDEWRIIRAPAKNAPLSGQGQRGVSQEAFRAGFAGAAARGDLSCI
jgi:hypothetical protein